MPRSLQEILDHADEYADRFEQYEPQPGDERTKQAGARIDFSWSEVEASLAGLAHAVQFRAEVDRAIIAGVRSARDRGESWSAIGQQLGTSGEAARQRYSQLLS